MISRLAAHGSARIFSVAFTLLTIAIAPRAQAAPVAFPPFTTGGDNVAINFNGISASANNAQIRDYMNGQFSAAGVTGRVNSITGASGDQNYDGEGFVVGPRDSQGRVTPLTLGTTDAGVLHAPGGDRFLINFNADLITMTFSEPIFAVSFDYEIFPNGNVPNGNTVPAANYPDFTFNAFTSGTSLANRVEHFRVFSVMPSTGPYPSSPNNANELAPQLLGSASFAFANGVTVLQFIDWPERIGIDNLFLSFSAPPPAAATPMPEPSTLLAWSLLATAGIAAWRRRARVQA